MKMILNLSTTHSCKKIIPYSTCFVNWKCYLKNPATFISYPVFTHWLSFSLWKTIIFSYYWSNSLFLILLIFLFIWLIYSFDISVLVHSLFAIKLKYVCPILSTWEKKCLPALLKVLYSWNNGLYYKETFTFTFKLLYSLINWMGW